MGELPTVVSVRTKMLLMAALVAAYVAQSALVYLDEPSGVRLEGEALAGARLFQDRGCQVCHQLHGFGGFLGPDLTNATRRLTDSRLRQVLTGGSGQMPALHLDESEIASVRAFLVAMDQTGQGQARIPATGPSSNELFAVAIDAALPHAPPAAVRGYRALDGRPCFACHLPFRAGISGAADLSLVTSRLDADELDQVLTTGKPPFMPTPVPAFSAEERADVAAWLGWLGEHRDELRRDVAAADESRRFRWSDVPWWEYGAVTP
jgi:nitric oxide reductase subunit C